MPWSEPRAAQIPVLLYSKPSTCSAPSHLPAPIMRIIHCNEKTDSLQSVSVGGGGQEEEEGKKKENVSFTIPGQKQGESLET